MKVSDAFPVPARSWCLLARKRAGNGVPAGLKLPAEIRPQCRAALRHNCSDGGESKTKEEASVSGGFLMGPPGLEPGTDGL